MKKMSRLPSSSKINYRALSGWGYALVLLAIVAPWFAHGGFLFFTDYAPGPQVRLDWTNSWWLFNLLLKGLALVLPLDFLQKLFIGGTLALLLLGGRRLVQVVLATGQAADQSLPGGGLVWALSLFALFNPFVYDRALYGQIGILVATGALLFTVSYLYRAWQAQDSRQLLGAGLATAVALLFAVHFVFLLALFYLLFCIGLWAKRQALTGDWWRRALWASLLVSAINANWLWALATHASPLVGFVEQGITGQDLVAFQTAGSTGLGTLGNVLLLSGFWGMEQHRYLDLTAQPGWQRGFALLVPIILYGLYAGWRRGGRRERWLGVGLVLLFVLAVGLAVGIKAPVTRPLTLWLYGHLPFYMGLREPQKWVAVLIPIYLYFLTLGASALTRTKLVVENLLVSGLILAAVIIMQAPALLWGFNRQAWPTPYPSDWKAVDQFLLSRTTAGRPCTDRILFLPWHMYMGFGWAGKIIANPAGTFFSCPVLTGTNMEWGGIYDNSRDPQGAAITAWLRTRGQDGRPALPSGPVRYIMLTKELDYAGYRWLHDLPYLQPLLETATLQVYEIKN